MNSLYDLLVIGGFFFTEYYIGKNGLGKNGSNQHIYYYSSINLLLFYMIYELEKADFSKVEKLFTRLKTNAAIESIFSNKNEARLFVDNPEKPESIFILTSWAYYYLAGKSDNDQFNSSLVNFLEKKYFPECIKKNYNTGFAFYPDTESWCKKIEELFSHLNLSKSGKIYFNYDEQHFNKSWRDYIPQGYSVKKISPEIINSIKKNQDFVDYINCFWVTFDKYFDKGLGYCAVDSENFATICISVFASENEREVGIKTFPDFQRKGLAYVTACAYIEECLKEGFIPVWSCFSENEVSLKLAEKLGYTIEASHPIFFANISET